MCQTKTIIYKACGHISTTTTPCLHSRAITRLRSIANTLPGIFHVDRTPPQQQWPAPPRRAASAYYADTRAPTIAPTITPTAPKLCHPPVYTQARSPGSFCPDCTAYFTSTARLSNLNFPVVVDPLGPVFQLNYEFVKLDHVWEGAIAPEMFPLEQLLGGQEGGDLVKGLRWREQLGASFWNGPRRAEAALRDSCCGRDVQRNQEQREPSRRTLRAATTHLPRAPAPAHTPPRHRERGSGSESLVRAPTAALLTSTSTGQPRLRRQTHGHDLRSYRSRMSSAALGSNRYYHVGRGGNSMCMPCTAKQASKRDGVGW